MLLFDFNSLGVLWLHIVRRVFVDIPLVFLILKILFGLLCLVSWFMSVHDQIKFFGPFEDFSISTDVFSD